MSISKPEIFNKIERQESPVDRLLLELQNKELIKFLDSPFLIGEAEMNPNFYTVPAKGIFSNPSPEKLNLVRTVFNSLLAKYNNNAYSIELYKNDTSAEVFVFENCVIRFYDCEYLKSKKEIFSKLSGSKYLEEILEAKYCDDLEFGYIVSEKLVPLVNTVGYDLKLNREIVKPEIIAKLISDVTQGLEYLHRNNIRHGDSRLDNIGFRPSDNSFVLFDLEGASYITQYKPASEDFDMFRGSLNYHNA